MSSSFAREKLSLHLRHRMAVFVSRVRATELMANLPCLTLSDKEEIQAKKDFSGNYAAMQLLLDYVQKRMNWPEELMSALEVLEHQDLAEDLRAEWTKHSHTNPFPPPAAATTAVRTHVDPVPTSSEGSPSSLVLPAQPAPPEVAPPEASLPPEVAPPEASLPPVVAAQPEAPPSSVPEAPMAGSSSEPAPRAPEAAAPTPVSAEEPTVISEPPASSQPGPIETVSLEDNSSHSDAPTQIALSETTETTPTLSVSDLIPAVTEITPTLPVSRLALSQTESPHTPAALDTFQSPERRPVQDTSPPTAKVTTFHQEAVENSDPTQVTEGDQRTEPPQSPPSQHFSPAPASPPVDTSMNEDDMNFSKPQVLHSEVKDSQPYSGDSTRLEMSVSDLERATADVMVPDPVTTSTPLPCQENGVPEEITEPLSHNEPQEDTYESTCLSSLGDQEVLLNVVYVSEDASIQNNDGQTPSMLGNNDVGVSETPPPHGKSQGLVMIVQDTSPSTKHPDAPRPAPTGSVPIVNVSSSAKNHHPLEPVVAEVMMEARAVPELKQEGTIGGSYYLLGAAVVAVSALFMAWRMKN
uniref:Mitochondrial antiviral-signaling protein n=1 Tax=Hucho hucho TaxID=62062 RepID=A0A4W5KT59_9TELE